MTTNGKTTGACNTEGLTNLPNGGHGKPKLLPEGVYSAVLVDARRLTNPFGERMGLIFKIVEGAYQGMELMETAALKDSPRGKLTELLRGIGCAEGPALSAHELIGRHCSIAVRHETNKTGNTYAAILQTFQ